MILRPDDSVRSTTFLKEEFEKNLRAISEGRSSFRFN